MLERLSRLPSGIAYPGPTARCKHSAPIRRFGNDTGSRNGFLGAADVHYCDRNIYLGLRSVISRKTHSMVNLLLVELDIYGYGPLRCCIDGGIRMVKYQLQPNEGVVLQETGIRYEPNKLSTAYTDELILTNLNLIHVRKGVFMGTKGVRYIPLNQVKVIGGKCQALVGKAQNGTAILQIYTQQGTEEFAFRINAKKNAGIWANEISCLVTGRDSENALESQDAPEYDFKDTVVGQFKDAFDEVGAAFGFEFGKLGQQQKSSVEHVSTKCSGCHAPITGVKGKSAVCKYCDTEQVL